jgi:hypothetical protein
MLIVSVYVVVIAVIAVIGVIGAILNQLQYPITAGTWI